MTEESDRLAEARALLEKGDAYPYRGLMRAACLALIDLAESLRAMAQEHQEREDGINRIDRKESEKSSETWPGCVTVGRGELFAMFPCAHLNAVVSGEGTSGRSWRCPDCGRVWVEVPPPFAGITSEGP